MSFSLYDQVKIVADDERPDLVGVIGRALEQKKDGWWVVGLDNEPEPLREYPPEALERHAPATKEWL